MTTSNVTFLKQLQDIWLSLTLLSYHKPAANNFENIEAKLSMNKSINIELKFLLLPQCFHSPLLHMCPNVSACGKG